MEHCRTVEMFICTFVFILASTANVISEHSQINADSERGIEPGTTVEIMGAYSDFRSAEVYSALNTSATIL